MNPETPDPGAQTNAGETVPPGTEQSGENVCRRCAGRGRIHGHECPECAGTGKVTTSVGDA